MFCDELVQKSLDEQLEGDALGHVTENDKIFALTDDRDVVLLDRWSSRQVTHEHLVDPQQVLGWIWFLFIG